jgi:ATP-dependent DNA helicase Rep
MMKTLSLNPEQTESVNYCEGPLLVLAGAGSGKTRVITQKIARLLEQTRDRYDTAHKRILAVTFTNKAAREMKQRVANLLSGSLPRSLLISTFHTFGLHFIRREHHTLSLNKNVSIFDTEDSIQLLKELSGKSESTAEADLTRTLQIISRWKNLGFLPNEVPKENLIPIEVQTLLWYEAYQDLLKQYHAVDFDDLILLPLQLLKSNAKIRAKWQEHIHYLLVDEYQDTNLAQYHLIKQLVGTHGQFTVVGDDHQSIYAWRGARPENLQQLQEDYPNLKIIKLEQNYRSTETILNAANQLIEKNSALFAKKLWSTLGLGERIQVIMANDDADEAEKVVLHLLKNKFDNRTEFKDYAILYRSNHQAKVLEKSLRAHRIPYQLSGGTSFFAKTEIKDILSYLRLLSNPDDDCAFLRIANVPKREIGPSTLGKLAAYAKNRSISLMAASFEIGLSQALPERALNNLRRFTEWLIYVEDNIQRGDSVAVITDLIKTIKYQEWLYDTCTSDTTADKRMENVWELVNWLKRLMSDTDRDTPKTFSEALQSVLLVDILERNAEEKSLNTVQLMTLHAAKGLEFPHVTIIGLEEDILPHKNSIEADSIEEERRLAYVGLTRAQETLTLSLCTHRKRYQETLACTPSRFLLELPESLLIWDKNKNQSPEQKIAQGQSHLANIRALLYTERT